MRSPDTGPGSLSRRALLGGVAGLGASRALPRAAATTPTLTVATRNLYLGVDLSRLFDADSMDDVRTIAGEMLREIRSHPYDARIDAIADEVAATRPDALALQEAAVFRVQTESDFAEDAAPNASTTVVDLLERCTSALESRGLDYDVAASTVTTDVEVPADDGDARTDVRLTDRTALLVRSDVETGESRAGTFDASLTYPLRGRSATIHRGYCLVELAVDGVDVTVAGAHLESADAYTRERQAEALLDRLPSDRPVVVAGDFNSGPGGSTGAYDLLTESFEDPTAALGSGSDAATCCQPSDLRSDDARFSRRVDHVLSRGDVRPTATQRVGADPESRVSADRGGETVRLWPSDHAGVVTTFAVPTATPTAAATTTRPTTRGETATDSERNASTNLPLYGSIAGIGSLSLAALAWYRKHR